MFDGDECCIHVPQQYNARAELQLLSATKMNIMSAQSSKSNLCIVQDSLLGAYLMTRDDTPIPRERFYNILVHGDWTTEYIKSRITHNAAIYRELGLDPDMVFTGKSLMSFCLPEDFYFSKKTSTIESQPFVKIRRGVMYEGAMSKSLLGSSHNSFIQLLHKEYNEDVCMAFINNVQFLANAWLCCYSFTIGVGDCVSSKTGIIQESIAKSFVEARQVEESVQNPKIKESKINSVLSKAKDVGMKIARDALRQDNGFIATVMSGAKGDFFNISQIAGLVGQQNITGSRIQPVFNKGKRTLPHYPFQIPESNVEQHFESRGFIRNSFIRGINPQEFWFHSMSGREGISDTAMKTASSGYVQRKMVKLMEDVQVKYDGTVRNSSGSIVQWAYGDDGFDRSQTVVLNGECEMMDISRCVERLNSEFGIRNQK